MESETSSVTDTTTMSEVRTALPVATLATNPNPPNHTTNTAPRHNPAASDLGDDLQ